MASGGADSSVGPLLVDRPAPEAKREQGPSRERREPTVIPGLILLLPVVVVSVCFYPGHMSGDSLSQIEQVREGDFTNQHAPLLTGLWSLFWPLGVRPGWVLVAQVATFVAGTYLLLRAFFSRRAAAALAAAIALSPPVFGMLGYLSRDTWFTALLLVTFGLVVRSARTQGRPAVLLLLAATVAAWMAVASRQNAIAAIVVGCMAIAWQALAGRGPWPRLRRAAAIAAGGVVLTVSLYGSQVVVTRLMDVENVHPEQYVYIYDLAMMSMEEGRNLFPPDVMARRDFAVIQQYFNIDSVNPFLFTQDPPVPVPLSASQVRSAQRAWKKELLGDPVDYLEGRWRLWLRQVSITRKPDFIYHPTIDDNQQGQRIKFPTLDEAASDYVEAFTDHPRSLDGGPLHTVWVYLGISAAAALVLLRRAIRPAQRLTGLLGLSAVTHQAGLFFGAMGTQYRFEFPVVSVGLIAMLALLQRARHRRRPVSDGEPAPPSASPMGTTGDWRRTEPQTHP